ncbi:hypothetical protein EVAR_79125_1 [Eumeta japonica]|uniref:Uncharacterized protein n=1 Tax=Eumeta variegata TaxID=151549 RepID=A0A4C1UUB6_EUMVA|nr:hypothetical protein EVAR_79125_1 [Eumeta japonica]
MLTVKHSKKRTRTWLEFVGGEAPQQALDAAAAAHGARVVRSAHTPLAPLSRISLTRYADLLDIHSCSASCRPPHAGRIYQRTRAYPQRPGVGRTLLTTVDIKSTITYGETCFVERALKFDYKNKHVAHDKFVERQGGARGGRESLPREIKGGRRPPRARRAPSS